MTGRAKLGSVSRWALHLMVVGLACVFLMPFLWLVSSSLQAREQVGRIPPEWLPRLHEVVLDSGEVVKVTPPEVIGVERLLVRVTEGKDQGTTVLVPPAAFSHGQVKLEADSGIAQGTSFSAEVIQRIPKHFVSVTEWTSANYVDRPLRRFYVDPSQVRAAVRPIFENYKQAILALSTDLRSRDTTILQLIGQSKLPWTGERDLTRSVTFITYLANTLTVALLSVFGTVLSSALAAYAFARLEWRGRNKLFFVTLATMMVPFPVLMIPLYTAFRALGWIGSLTPLWLPAALGTAFNIFLLRQFFATIPKELSEAARLDGCSELGIFLRIILPLSKPALAVVAVFHLLFVWNDFLGPLIFLTEPRTFTIALGLQQYQSQNGGSEWHLLMAAATLLVLPVVLLFFFAQKTFVQGIATTGIKG